MELRALSRALEALGARGGGEKEKQRQRGSEGSETKRRFGWQMRRKPQKLGTLLGG